MQTLSPTRCLRAAPLILLAALALGLPGCTLLSLAGLIAAPSIAIDPQYVIPKGHQVVVIVDDLHHAASPHLREAIASTAVFHLKKADKFKVVSDAEVNDAIAKLGDRWTGAHGQKSVSAASLGAALHADTVIYANIESSQIQLADNVYQPQVLLSIKAYDAASGRCMFPSSPDGDNMRSTGFVIETNISPKDLSAAGRSAPSVAENKLAAQAGMDLAHVFVKYYPKQPGDTLGQD